MFRGQLARTLRILDHHYAAAAVMTSGVGGALIWSALADQSYARILNTRWIKQWPWPSGVASVHSFVASGLMTLFFFAVGLELSRELRQGLLVHARRSVPALAGAVGGMAVTALMAVVVGYVAHSPPLRHGWGIPMATDIAFTLAVVAIAGNRLPAALRIFLLTLAIADDVLSVTALTFVGANHVRLVALALILVVALGAQRLSQHRSSNAWRLAILGALWLSFLWARVEPPLAGIVAALVVPFDVDRSPRLEQTMNRWSVGLVLPLFALVSCGVHWSSLSLHASTVTIVTATVGIRIVGKVVGITGGVTLARAAHFRLDPLIRWPLLATGALVCAIGFTVPLLFAGALFSPSSVAYGAFTLGLLIASLVAGSLGAVLLRLQARRY